MVNLDGDTIFYVKRYSDELAFYVRCVHEKWKGQTTIEWFFTAIDTICDSIERLSIGLRITMITMVLEDKDHLSGFPVVFATPETADNILIDIGKNLMNHIKYFANLLKIFRKIILKEKEFALKTIFFATVMNI